MATLAIDSSSLISFSESCLVGTIPFLKEKTGARLVITPEVMREIVDRPLHSNAHAFSALRLNQLIENKTLEVKKPVAGLAEKMAAAANAIFVVRGIPLEILQMGEAECLALAAHEGVDALVVDEKTTRLLLEGPSTMLEKIKAEHRSRVEVDKNRLAEWKTLTGRIIVMRSSELLAIAASKGLFKEFGSQANTAFHAALFSLRMSGCSLSLKELADYSKVRV